MDFYLALHEMVAGVLNGTLAVAVPALSAIGLKYLHKRFGITISEAQKQQLDGLALRAVQTASQRFKPNKENAQSLEERNKVNKFKRANAVEQLISDAAQVGQKVPPSLAENLVEAGVNRLKRERGAL